MMNKTKHILTFFLLLCLSSFAQQQATEVTISGTVVDGSNEPIPGASIYVQGKVGADTSSDVEGKFSIQVVSGYQLILSFVGFYTADYVAIEDKAGFIITSEERL